MFELEGIEEYRNIPSKENILRATLGQPLHWDPIENFTIGEIQRDNNYSIETFAITNCKNVIDSVLNAAI